ncbi:MAG: hypothetical protein M3391_04370 [Actinomycetota bacterium]|nr:hypothetical protein [Actinomycetota bacterium]
MYDDNPNPLPTGAARIGKRIEARLEVYAALEEELTLLTATYLDCGVLFGTVFPPEHAARGSGDGIPLPSLLHATHRVQDRWENASESGRKLDSELAGRKRGYPAATAGAGQVLRHTV